MSIYDQDPETGETRPYKAFGNPADRTELMIERVIELGALIGAKQESVRLMAHERAELLTALYEREGMTTRALGERVRMTGPRVVQIMGQLRGWNDEDA